MTYPSRESAPRGRLRPAPGAGGPCARSAAPCLRRGIEDSEPNSIREVLLAELRDDLRRDRQVDDVVEGEVLLDLAEVLLALDRAFDVLLRHALVLRPGFR